MNLNFLSMFSGIGAPEKALEDMGIHYNLVGYSEIDKYASRSYAAIHRVPETMNLGDITKVDATKLPKNIDLAVYGFPCQDISNAGKMQGLFKEDGTQTRSGLFFEALRIIEETRPKVAIAENVKNLTSKRFSNEFAIVLDSLDKAGYNNYWKVLNAKDFGIPQNRERVFIVSIRKDIDTGSFQFPEGFPLKKRLKDILEDAVDEKYFLSETAMAGLIAHKERNAQSGNGFGFQAKTEDDIASCIRARYYKDGSECLIASTDIVKQIGNCCPTKTRDNPNQGRIYDSDYLSPALNCMGGGNRQPFVMVKEATKKGYAEAAEGDSVNLEQPNSTTRRGRVGKGVAQTLTTSCNQAVVEPNVLRQVRTEYGKEVRKAYESGETEEKWGSMKQWEPRTDGVANMLSTVQKDNLLAEPDVGGLRLRKLTPKECFRLMGFDDESFHRAEAVNSNSQLYKQAGNSIVVPVIQNIIQNLVDANVLHPVGVMSD